MTDSFHRLLIATVLIAGFIIITSEPAPGPQITTVKVKQIDARELIK